MSWTDSTLFLRMLVVAFRTFLWPSYKFLAELDANTLLLQHIHFTIRRRDKHDCTVDQLIHDWVTLPSAPLACGVRRYYQVSYMVVTSILLAVSKKKILSRIFLIRPRTFNLETPVLLPAEQQYPTYVLASWRRKIRSIFTTSQVKQSIVTQLMNHGPAAVLAHRPSFTIVRISWFPRFTGPQFLNPLKSKLVQIVFKDSVVPQRKHNSSPLQRSTG
jgi:hypothetical protein